jgi:hypothetical protein
MFLGFGFAMYKFLYHLWILEAYHDIAIDMKNELWNLQNGIKT